MAFRLELLRAFALVRDRQVVDLTAGAQRLLAFLALRRRSLRRSTVAGTLWQDAPAGRRSGNLRSALWRINRVDRRLVIATGDLLGLSPDVEVDVGEAAQQARQLLDGASAAALERGHLIADLLPDWPDDWVLVERERFRQLRLHALEALSERLSRLGSHAEAIEAARVAVSAEPLRESAHRALIAAYLDGGRRLDADRQYRECRDLLRRNLAIAPSSLLQRIVRAGP